MERYRLTKEKPRQRVRLRQRKPANRKQLTVDKIRKLVPKKDKQYLVWDSGTDGQRGLCVLVSPKGAKSFRCCFYFDGSWKPHFMHLGRVDEGMTLEEAREL